MKSFSKEAKEASFARQRRMTANRTPDAQESPCRRSNSRTRRRRRLRTTAHPIFFVQMTPKEEGAQTSERRTALRTRQRPATDVPASRTCANSKARVILCRRVNCIAQALQWKRRGTMEPPTRPPTDLTPVLDGVALIMNLSTLGQKTLPTFGTTAAENGAAVFRGHAGTESKLALAAALGRLISSLAHNEKLVSEVTQAVEDFSTQPGERSYTFLMYCQADI